MTIGWQKANLLNCLHMLSYGSAPNMMEGGFQLRPATLAQWPARARGWTCLRSGSRDAQSQQCVFGAAPITMKGFYTSTPSNTSNMAGAFTGPTEDVTGRYAEVQPLNVTLSLICISNQLELCREPDLV